VSAEEGFEVVCSRCGFVTFLPPAGTGMVSIRPLMGWTAPPMLCPDCVTRGDES